MKIPLVDLKRQYQSLKPEMDAAIQDVVTNAAFIGGPVRESFEKEFAEAQQAQFAIGVGNGTDSLMIALKAMGIGPGDEVVVPANSFIATSEMVSAVGATPVFVDVDERTFNIDLAKLEALLAKRAHKNGDRVRAVIPVHLYGRMVDMERVSHLCEQHDLFCLEDAAQAVLARYKNKCAGQWGDAASFSFFPGKNLGAYGDGGGLTTNDAALAEKMRKLANHGRIGKYDHDMEGYNSRLDALQAAVLRVKLPRLAEWTRQRIAKAHRYDELLKGTPNLTLPELPPDGEHVYHLYVVRVPNRDRVLAALKEKGVEAGVHYPIALPLLKAYAHLGHGPADFSVAAKLQNEILSLPLFPEITDEEQIYVAKTLREILG